MKQQHQHGCSTWVEEWLAEGTWAPATVRAYRLELRRWLAYVDAEGISSSLTEKGVLSFLDQLTSHDERVLLALGVRSPLKTSSLAQTRRILGCFLLWLATRERIAISVAVAIRTWRPSKRLDVSPVDDARLKVRVRQDVHRINSPSARLAQGLAGWLGATPKELSQLRNGDVRLRRGALEVQLPVEGGKAWRVAPRYLVSEWRSVKRAAPKATHVFANRHSLSPLSVGHIGRLIARACSPMTAIRVGGARAQKRAAVAQMTMAGITHAELLYHFRRSSLPQVHELIRKGHGLVQVLDQIVAQRTD
ncbi:MAG: hypothetical protein EPN68_06505 [Rhodanobacter sp.]|nr:MAG: hypothetical protein EPN68_06505 [Rhodanobacter sp.]